MIKLKNLLTESTQIHAYSDELGEYIRNLKPNIKGLKFSIERMTGGWAWENNNISIYATFGWEGKKEVPIEDGDTGKIIKTLKYNPKFDLKTDAKWYISNMKKHLPGIIKDLK